MNTRQDRRTTLIPVKPSEAMLRAGMRASGRNADTVWRIFTAMVEATEAYPEETAKDVIAGPAEVDQIEIDEEVPAL